MMLRPQLEALRLAYARAGGRLITSTIVREPRAHLLSVYRMWPPWTRLHGQQPSVVPLLPWLRDGGRELLQRRSQNFSVHLGPHYLPRGYQATRLAVGSLVSAPNASSSTGCLADRAYDALTSTFDLICTTDNLTAAAHALAALAGVRAPPRIKWDRHDAVLSPVQLAAARQALEVGRNATLRDALALATACDQRFFGRMFPARACSARVPATLLQDPRTIR